MTREAWLLLIAFPTLAAAPARYLSAQSTAPETWGERAAYTVVAGYELVPAYEGLRLRPDWGPIGEYAPTGGVYCSQETDSNGFAHAVARVELPEGAALDNLHHWSYDVSQSLDMYYQFWEVCHAPGDATPAAAALAEGFTLGSGGYQYWSSALGGHTVKNKACMYTIEVRFGTGNGCPADQDLQVIKFAVQWHRQVSPAPATATFNDVPVSHPFFQFVEALSKSGITGGCSVSPPLYCPDQALTRGQMAVFLSKALGVQWP